MNSKQKGNTYEREIANLFSEKFQDTFRRVPSSGMYTGGKNRFKENVANLRSDAQEILSSDIICPAWFPFAIELKHYKSSPNMYSLLRKKKNQIGDADLDKWLEQAKSDAIFAKKKYLLIFKITGKAEFIAVDYQEFVTTFSHKIPNIYIIYKGSIIIDKELFLEEYIWDYFPDDKKLLKPTQTNINKDSSSLLQ